MKEGFKTVTHSRLGIFDSMIFVKMGLDRRGEALDLGEFNHTKLVLGDNWGSRAKKPAFLKKLSKKLANSNKTVPEFKNEDHLSKITGKILSELKAKKIYKI